MNRESGCDGRGRECRVSLLTAFASFTSRTARREGNRMMNVEREARQAKEGSKVGCISQPFPASLFHSCLVTFPIRLSSSTPSAAPRSLREANDTRKEPYGGNEVRNSRVRSGTEANVTETHERYHLHHFLSSPVSLSVPYTGGTSPTGGTTTGRRDTGESTTLGTFYPHLSRLTAPLWLGSLGPTGHSMLPAQPSYRRSFTYSINE